MKKRAKPNRRRVCRKKGQERTETGAGRQRKERREKCREREEKRGESKEVMKWL